MPEKGENKTPTINNSSVPVKSEEEARAVWRDVTAVCFDVDSTVCADEAVDEIAAMYGVGSAVAEWTAKAMNGQISFRNALTASLSLMKPSRSQLDAYCKQHPPKFTPGIKELVAELHSRNVAVYLVSGGFSHVILPIAKILNIPDENVYTNVLLFDEEGNYRGFDPSQPTSDSGGKPKVCAMLKSKFKYSKLVMIGDGVTDLEASPPADLFIGFGGNEIRDVVRRRAPWFVHSFKELLDELTLKGKPPKQ